MNNLHCHTHCSIQLHTPLTHPSLTCPLTFPPPQTAPTPAPPPPPPQLLLTSTFTYTPNCHILSHLIHPLTSPSCNHLHPPSSSPLSDKTTWLLTNAPYTTNCYTPPPSPAPFPQTVVPGSSQIMLQPLMSDSLRLDVRRETLGTRDQQLRCNIWTSRRGGQVGTSDLGPRNTAADRGRVVWNNNSYICMTMWNKAVDRGRVIWNDNGDTGVTSVWQHKWNTATDRWRVIWNDIGDTGVTSAWQLDQNTTTDRGRVIWNDNSATGVTSNNSTRTPPQTGEGSSGMITVLQVWLLSNNSTRTPPQIGEGSSGMITVLQVWLLSDNTSWTQLQTREGLSGTITVIYVWLLSENTSATSLGWWVHT